jgi:hypothetical protein
MMAMPSSMDLVARSHSANTSTSPGLSTLMALSSPGRPRTDLPDALSPLRFSRLSPGG